MIEINLNNMNKSLLLLGVALYLGLNSSNAQTTYGLKTGVNLSKYSKPINEDLKGYETNNVSFYVTGFADIPVASQFSIQPGVSLQTKGAKYKGSSGENSASASVNVMSLEIPVNAVYYFPVGYGDLFVGAGPYIGYNLSGKTKLALDGESLEDSKIKFTGKDKDMNALDYGANFLLGYKLPSGLLINAGYGLGLADVVPDNPTNTKYANRVLSFGLGFQF